MNFREGAAAWRCRNRTNLFVLLVEGGDPNFNGGPQRASGQTPNQPRRAIHFTASSTGTIVNAKPMQQPQSAGERLNVPNARWKNGT